MNEPIETLERELASLQPMKPSVDLRVQIEREIRALENTNRPSSAAIWSLVITTGALAAGLLIAVLPSHHNGLPQPQPHSSILAASVFSDSLPTFWTYHRAVTTPSQSLDGLLDRHVTDITATDDSLNYVNALRPFSSQNQSAPGGL